MKRQRKYKSGEPFATVGELTAWVQAGGWVMWKGRPKHPTIIRHQTLDTLLCCLSQFRQAVPVGPEEDPRQKMLDFLDVKHWQRSVM